MAGLVDALTVGWLLWRAQLQMFLNQTVRSRKAGRIVSSIVGAAVILLAWSWEGFVTVLLLRVANRFGASVNLVSLLSLAFFAYTGVLVFSRRGPADPPAGGGSGPKPAAADQEAVRAAVRG